MEGLRSWRALGAGVCLALAACAPDSGSGTPVSFAPYVAIGLGDPGLVAAVSATPARRFVLAFVLAGQGRCRPVWGAGRAVTDPALLADIAAVRAAGGSVTVASGGASGTYLENTCTSADELAGAYRSALSATGADRLDVDVEAAVPVQVVADALTLVRRDAGVTVTVGVTGAARGLTPAATALLHALASRGTDVTVNAMLMNFPARGDWQTALLAAADTVAGQIAQVWPDGGQHGAYRRLGLTLMAGRNDTGAVTTVADAQAVRDYAQAHHIAFVGLWSLGRDNGTCPGRTAASPDCSGLDQDPYAFTRSLA